MSGSQRYQGRSRSRSRQHSCVRYTTYVLQLTGGKYYVGKTTRPIEDRYQEHVSGKVPSIWSRLHKPIRILKTFKSPREGTELTITKEYMARMGIDNVRGSCYSLPQLTELQLQYLELQIMEIRADLQLCFNCGGDHLMYNCRKVGLKKSSKVIKPPMKDALCFDDVKIFAEEHQNTTIHSSLSPVSMQETESAPQTKCFTDLHNTQ